jgi:hypothetical protein
LRDESPEDLSWRAPNLGELKAFDETLERAVFIYTTLERARDAFSEGRASYERATAEIRHLIEQIKLAGEEVIDACRSVVRFFPEGVSKTLADFFDGNGNAFVRFCREFVETQKHPREVRKNSSRGRSEKSRPTPPETAVSVSGS